MTMKSAWLARAMSLVLGTAATLEATPVPEPSSWALMGLGLGLVVWLTKGRR